MSLYREPGRDRRRRLRVAAIAGVLVTVAIVLVVLLVAGGSGAPSPAEHTSNARSAASRALDGLELLEIEYGQAVRDGTVVAPTEYGAAQADVERAAGALNDRREDLAAVDPAALAAAQAALVRVRTAVAARVPAAELQPLLRSARSALAPFNR